MKRVNRLQVLNLILPPFIYIVILVFALTYVTTINNTIMNITIIDKSIICYYSMLLLVNKAFIAKRIP